MGIRIQALLRPLFIAVVAVAAAGIYFFGFTTPGALFLARTFLARPETRAAVRIHSGKGSLVKGMVFQGISMDGVFPRTHIPLHVKVPEVRLEPLLPSNPLPRMHVRDGQLLMPGDQVLRFYGDYADSRMQFSLYSSWFSLGAVLRLYPPFENLRFMEGMLADIDLSLYSRVTAPRLKGNVTVEEGSFRGFVVKNVPCSVDLSAERSMLRWRLRGKVLFNGGVLFARKARIDLEEGTITFTGDPLAPEFSIKGVSRVGETKIHLALTGTARDPDLLLTSSPPLPQSQLMAMLVTGTPWAGLSETAGQGRITPGLVKDFVDYFFLGGTASGISSKLGIPEISLQYDATSQGVSVRKSITDTLSIEGSGETRSISNTTAGKANSQQDNKIELKLKKTF